MKKAINNKAAFTLIELLAVIVILGIIMLIAIPSVTGYITESRKAAYVKTAQQITQAVNYKIINSIYSVDDLNTVYYFDYRIGDLEKGGFKSPFADWVQAYVIVTNSGNGNLNFYWSSVDQEGMRIDPKKQVNDLSKNDVYHSNSLTVSNTNYIGARDNVVIYHYDGSSENKFASNEMTNEEASSCFSFRKLEDSTYAITDYNQSKCGSEVRVPSSIDGKTVTLIDRNAFKGKHLTSVTLYYGITEIGYGAFQNNDISYLKLSASVRKIGEYAFYKNKITELVLPEGIQTISSYAFRSNLISNITFPKTLTTIGTYAFMDNKLTEISINSNASIGGAAFSGNQITDSSAFIYARNKDGSVDYSKIIGYAGDSTDIVIPKESHGVTLKTIADNAFLGCHLKSVVIPDTVTSIGGSAFYSNYLTSINFPDGLKTIGGSAFRNNRLTSINIPDSVTSIGSGAFRNNCVSADNSVMYAKKSDGSWDYSKIVSLTGGSNCNIRNITIPASKNGVALERIVSSAFEGSGLQSITLPDLSLTPNLTIDNGAFSNNNVPLSKAFFYRIQNGKIDYSYISSFAGSGSGTLTIPATAGPDNTPLKTISSGFTWKSYSTYIIPESVVTIQSAAFSKSAVCNQNLTKIVNKTGRAFDWYQLLGSTYSKERQPFVTGIVEHQAGNVTITDQ